MGLNGLGLAEATWRRVRAEHPAFADVEVTIAVGLQLLMDVHPAQLANAVAVAGQLAAKGPLDEPGDPSEVPAG